MITKLHGLTKEEFNELITLKEISFREAKLIPTDKPGDEMALTSVFFGGLKFVKEFRNQIFKTLKINQIGEILYLTEFVFKDYPNARFDGMIIVFKSGKIDDVAIFEIKNNTNVISKEQIDKYVDICKQLKIENLITISNQFVSDITHCPLNISSSKNFKRYHLSWTFVLTIGQLLLFKNDMNIADSDQISIMKEVLSYFECKKSGILGNTNMGTSWVTLCEQVTAGATISPKSIELISSVESWMQEEQDLALFLSRQLGVLVDIKNNKSNMKSQLDEYKKDFLNTKTLETSFKIKGTVSDYVIMIDFIKRMLTFSVSLSVGVGTSRMKIQWIKKQIDNCFKKNEELSKIKQSIFIDIYFKNSSKSERLSINNLESVINAYGTKEIRSLNISLIKDYAKIFISPIKFNLELEKDTLEFYRLIIQNLKKWEDKAPKVEISIKETKDVLIEEMATSNSMNNIVQHNEFRNEVEVCPLLLLTYNKNN